MVVYDVSDKESLTKVEYWIKNIKTHASENVRVVLVGNKTDLRKKYEESEEMISSMDEGRAMNNINTENIDTDVSTQDSTLLAPPVCSDYAAGQAVVTAGIWSGARSVGATQGSRATAEGAGSTGGQSVGSGEVAVGCTEPSNAVRTVRQAVGVSGTSDRQTNRFCDAA